MNSATIHHLVNKYKTPLYIYSLETIKEKIRVLRETLPKQVELFYSVKANPNEELLQTINLSVAGMEIASGGELKKVINAEVNADNVIFVGPGKTYDELEMAISRNLYCIVIESVQEAKIVDKIALKHDKIVRIAIRVNPIRGNKSARIKMSGVAKPFGIDEEKLLPDLQNILELTNIALLGVYTYNGTQALEAESISSSMENTFLIAKSVQDYIRRPIEFIGFGGGYGIPYFQTETKLNMDELKVRLNEVFSKYEHLFSKTIRYVSESGRYIVAECGSYVVKVLYKKESRGTNYAIVDGGSNFYASTAGLGKFLRQNLPIYTLNENVESEKVTIVGPLCTPTDILSQNIILPKCSEGDIIVFPKSGAYGLSASPVNFLSHTRPCEVLTDEKEHVV